MALSNFTKGGQNLSQKMRMFFNVFWRIVTVFFVSWILTSGVLIYFHTTPYQRYQTMTLIKVVPFAFLFENTEAGLSKIGLAPKSEKARAKDEFKMSYKSPNGYIQQLPVSWIADIIFMSNYSQGMKPILFRSLLQGLLFSLLITLILGKLLMAYGKSVTANKVLRGARICEPNKLKKRIKKKGKGKVSPLKLSGIPLPLGAETQHLWINGTTGTGKTVAFSELMEQVRKQKQRAIVYDIMGTFVERFYRPGKDIILNPFDSRMPAWNIWAECEESNDYDKIAASQIPVMPGAASHDPFWTKAARSLYACTARRLKENGRANNRTLMRTLLTADLEHLRELLKDTEAESLVAEELEKMALSVKAILTDYIKGMRFLPDEGELFSIRDWVRNGEGVDNTDNTNSRESNNDDSWLFITSRADCHETILPLLSTWYDIAITAALSLDKREDRRIYNFIDELPTLQYLSSLQSGMAQGRQKGLCFILGTQDLSQLRVNYGADNAKSLIGNSNNKLILRTADDAEDIANLFNKSEVEEYTENTSYGATKNRDGVSINKQRTLRNVVLPSELQTLDDLEAYFKVSGNYPLTKIKLKYTEYEEPNKGLIRRKGEIDCLAGENWQNIPERPEGEEQNEEENSKNSDSDNTTEKPSTKTNGDTEEASDIAEKVLSHQQNKAPVKSYGELPNVKHTKKENIQASKDIERESANSSPKEDKKNNAFDNW